MNSGVQGLVSVKDYFGHKTSFFCDGNGLVGKSLLNDLIWCWTFLLSDCDWKHIRSHGPQRISFEDDQLLVFFYKPFAYGCFKDFMLQFQCCWLIININVSNCL